MKHSLRKLVSILSVSALLSVSLVGCGSQAGKSDASAAKPASDYPKKPIQLVLIHKAGSSTDIIARTLQPYLSKELGVNVVVQNVTGGGGTQAMSQLNKAKPDGYTLLMTPFPSATLKQVLTPNVDFDIANFTYVGGVSAKDNNVIAVNASSPYKTLGDLMTAAKTKTLKIAGSGMATNGQLAAALLLDKGNMKFTYVPFEGGPESLNAVLGNQVDGTVADIVGAISLAKSGKIRLLAVTGTQRDSRFPDVPTVQESGVDGAAFDTVVGIVGPKDLPADITKKLSDAIQKVTSNKEFIDSGAKTGFTVSYTNSDDLKAASLKLLEQVKGEKTTLGSMK